MSAAGALRRAWWRRWASLPAVVALLFATSVVAAAVGPGQAFGLGHAPMAVQVVTAAGQPAAGRNPDVRLDTGGRSFTVAPDVGAVAWLAARAGSGLATWWHRRQDTGGHRAQAVRETYQGRGPPGRRAGDALS
jgi:hypothetical protein